MDLNQRIFEKFDYFEKRLDDTCLRIERIDEYIKHEQGKADEIIRRKDRKINWGIGLLGAVVGVTEILSFLDIV